MRKCRISFCLDLRINATSSEAIGGECRTNVTTTVSEKRIQVDVPAGQTLLQFLREQGYRSVKYGCETTDCGLCSVWMDGKTMLSCSVSVRHADGHRITTLEGVEKEAKEFMDFVAKEKTEQCGFCSPGMMIRVLATKKENRTWTDEEIEHWSIGSLRRCTGCMG